jgi:hypothetical protein
MKGIKKWPITYKQNSIRPGEELGMYLNRPIINQSIGQEENNEN